MSKRKKQKRKSNFIKPFLCTFCIVVSVGIFAMLAYLWIIEPAQEMSSVLPLVKETIPHKGVEPQGETEGQEGAETEPMSKYADELNDPQYMAENNIHAKEAGDPEAVTIAFAGDILFDDSYAVMGTMLRNGGIISNAIAPDLIQEMKSVDIMMLNNEFPYSDRGISTEGKQFTFRAKPSYVPYLLDLGVDIVSLANNHAYDYGEEAFLDTMTNLGEQGIAYVGAGVNLQEARKPVYYIINDIKIAFVSATQIERLDNPDTKGATESSAGVFRCLDSENLLQTVREAKENSDFVIVYLHWGTENEETIDWLQEKQAPEVVAAGADLIIGDHPHCLQKISMIQGVPVIYSLGNFWFNSKTLDTGIVKITLTKDGMQSYQFIPCLQSDCKTTLLQGEEKQRVLTYMQSISENVQIDADGYVTW